MLRKWQKQKDRQEDMNDKKRPKRAAIKGQQSDEVEREGGGKKDTCVYQSVREMPPFSPLPPDGVGSEMDSDKQPTFR